MSESRYDNENPHVHVHISVQHARFLPFENVRLLLNTIAFHTWAATEDKAAEARRLIEGTLLAMAWDTPPWGAETRSARAAYGWEYVDGRPLSMFLLGSQNDGSGAKFYLKARSAIASWAK
jgi:hypothetical protein